MSFNADSDEEFDPALFLKAQLVSYANALLEIGRGKKESHWMWFILPQLRGLGRSYNSEIYGFHGIDHARDFLFHDVLGSWLRQCVHALLDLPEVSVSKVFDYPDDLKLHACLTLFDNVAPKDVFEKALQRFFDGRRHLDTLRSLDRRASVRRRIIRGFVRPGNNGLIITVEEARSDGHYPHHVSVPSLSRLVMIFPCTGIGRWS